MKEQRQWKGRCTCVVLNSQCNAVVKPSSHWDPNTPPTPQPSCSALIFLHSVLEMILVSLLHSTPWERGGCQESCRVVPVVWYANPSSLRCQLACCSQSGEERQNTRTSDRCTAAQAHRTVAGCTQMGTDAQPHTEGYRSRKMYKAAWSGCSIQTHTHAARLAENVGLVWKQHLLLANITKNNVDVGVA